MVQGVVHSRILTSTQCYDQHLWSEKNFAQRSIVFKYEFCSEKYCVQIWIVLRKKFCIEKNCAQRRIFGVSEKNMTFLWWLFNSLCPEKCLDYFLQKKLVQGVVHSRILTSTQCYALIVSGPSRWSEWRIWCPLFGKPLILLSRGFRAPCSWKRPWIFYGPRQNC